MENVCKFWWLRLNENDAQSKIALKVTQLLKHNPEQKTFFPPVSLRKYLSHPAFFPYGPVGSKLLQKIAG